MKNALVTIILSSLGICPGLAHNIHHEETLSRDWDAKGISFKGSFLFHRNDSVFFELSNQQTAGYPMAAFQDGDRKYLEARIEDIRLLNKQGTDTAALEYHHPKHNALLIPLLIAALLCSGSIALFMRPRRKLALPVFIAVASFILLSFTDPNIIQIAFQPFAPHVSTFWDSNYFYVESKGIPGTHAMMVGISSHGWQQQVPIPQCYIGSNAWSIPLHPVMAANPIPVDQVHFTRGAIAIAVNGVPIFNPYTNTGVDAYLDGQLDSYGGHSGRGDDYHYHIAPLHLYSHTDSTFPIAYAFDGFAVYGGSEPDGTPMAILDANHGHAFSGDYHYHGTSAAPYMIAKFAGVVTEDATHQLIPQAQAQPVRTENWTPLNGALITDCAPNGSENGYNLSYTLNGVAGYATNYSWSGTTYTFDYVSPTGTTTKNYAGFMQCDVAVPVPGITETGNLVVFPNPFSDKIYLLNSSVNDFYTLYNSAGQIVFAGKNIEQQDFSQAAKGLYYLRTRNQNKIYTLIKAE